MQIDEISPAYIGEDLIVLAGNIDTPRPRVGQPMIVDVDYSATRAYGGTSLPVELLIQGPSTANWRTKIYRKFLPPFVSFIPSEGGDHLVLLRELAHNRFLGRLVISVAG